jgi:hypothetical protein
MALGYRFVAHKTRATFAGTGTTLALSGISPGSILLCGLSWFDANGDDISDVSDDVNGSWPSTTIHQLQSDQAGIQMWYFENSGDDPTLLTVTFPNTGGSNNMGLEFDVVEILGGMTANALDKNITNSGNGQNASIAWGTLAQQDEILFQLMHHDGNTRTLDEDAADGYTLIGENHSDSGGNPYLFQYKIVSTTTPPDANVTIGTGAVNWGTRGLSFKAAAAGATPLPSADVLATHSRRRYGF